MFTRAHLLDPVALETFLSRYYESEQLVIGRGDPSHYVLIRRLMREGMVVAAADRC
ncbi:MAG TPA: hypothetical protein VFC37_14815 [Terracidiphilus sp.]|nr:hypothetical protein [Terracidiphilus sp.]